MKHKHLTFLLAVLMSMVASVDSVYGATEIDGIYYRFSTSGNQAFVTYKESSNGTYYSYYSGNVIIPKTISVNSYYGSRTYDVVGIDSHAFDGCKRLTSVTIPNSVTSIGSYAFSGCI